MKKFIAISFLLIMSSTIFSQQTNPSSALTKQDYLKKSKHQKTAAWILVSGGGLCAALGSVQFNFAGSDGEVNNSSSAVFLVTGLTAIGASIPLFIASSKNKKKAMSISFNNQSIPSVQNNVLVYHLIPSIKFKINL